MKKTTWGMLLLALAGAAQAEVVGRMLLSAGDVTAVRAGRSAPLGPGAEVESGDEIRTGPASNAQIRFTDAGIVALRSDSAFRIDEYAFKGQQDGSEKAIFSLLKGGLRTITGLVGRVNQRTYGIRTPTATVGIRGTHFNLVHCEDDCRNADGSIAPNGSYGGVSDGRVSVTPLGAIQQRVTRAEAAGIQLAMAGSASDMPALGGGVTTAPVLDSDMPAPFQLAQAPGGASLERIFGAGDFFHVPDANTPAQQLLVPPLFLTDKLAAQTRSAQTRGNEGGAAAASAVTVDGRAQPTALPPPPLPFVVTETRNAQGNSVVLGVAPNGWVTVFAPSSSVNVIGDERDPATFNASGQLLAFGPTQSGVSGMLGSGTMADTGSYTASDGTIVNWGAWLPPGTSISSGGHPFASDLPVLWLTVNDVQNIHNPTQGIVNYNYIGGPHPRDQAGNVGSVTSSTATVDFGARQFNLAMGMNFPNVNGVGPATFSVSGSGSRINSPNNLDFSGSLSGSCTGAGCNGATSSGPVSLGVGGNNGYSLAAAGGGLFNATLGGTVIFLNGYAAIGGAATPSARQVAQLGWLTSGGNTSSGTFDSTNDQLTFAGNLLASYVQGSGGSQSGQLGSGTVVEVGSNAAAGNMNWGRWTGPFQVRDISGTLQTTISTGVPYVFGDHTDLMPTTGNVIYSYVGGPNPVDANGNVGAFTGGAIGVNFVTRGISIASPLTLNAGGVNFSLNSCSINCSYPSPTTPHINNAQLIGTCSGGSCTSVVASLFGHFLGNNAQGLATTGIVNPSSGPKVIFGAGFKQP